MGRFKSFFCLALIILFVASFCSCTQPGDTADTAETSSLEENEAEGEDAAPEKDEVEEIQPTVSADVDFDAINNEDDNCPSVFNPEQTDTDGDKQGDTCDDDDDNDTIPDKKDNCSLVQNSDQQNKDDDSLGDACDNDSDNDGVVDEDDNCPLVSNQHQGNADGDDLGDECDEDADNDEIPNEEDNCPLVANVDQVDTDEDGMGDACVNDADGDGIANDNDNCPLNENPDQKDADGDQLGNACDFHTTFVDDSIDLFAMGAFTDTIWDTDDESIEIALKIMELPDNAANSWTDMTGNVLLLHMNEPDGQSCKEDMHICDASDNNNDGINLGATYGIDGKLNTALRFDGDGYISIDSSDNLKLGKHQTFGAWIYVTEDQSTWARIIGKGDSANRNYGLWRQDDGDMLCQWYGTSNGGCWNDGGVGDPANIPIGEWHHVACTYDSVSTKLYVDGQLIRTCSYGGTPHTSSDPVTIGHSGFETYYFKGLIDEVAIYNRALSGIEIAEQYDKQASPAMHSGTFISRVMDAGAEVDWNKISWISPAPYNKELPDDNGMDYIYDEGNTDMFGNILLMHMNDIGENAQDKGKIQDSSENGNHGTLLTGDPNSKSTEGKFNTALIFDGDDKITTPINTTFKDFSVEIWFKDDGHIRSHERLMDKSSSKCFWLGRDATKPNRWGGGIKETSTPYGIFIPLADGEWHQLVSVRKGNKHYLYGDGGKVFASNTVSDTECDSSFLIIGKRNDSVSDNQNFTGVIDEVSVYDRALTPEEIAAHYRRGTAQLKFQVRTGNDESIAGKKFIGPDGKTSSYFSEELNNTSQIPSLSLKNILPGRYIQYKAYFETPSQNILPKLKQVEIGPVLFEDDEES